MLHRVLQEIEAAQGAVNLGELSRKLGVERSALDGMIGYWVRKGRLRDESQPVEIPLNNCTSGSCGHACPGPQSCPFVMQLPKSYTLRGQRTQPTNPPAATD